jgi:hypothetical protein
MRTRKLSGLLPEYQPLTRISIYPDNGINSQAAVPPRVGVFFLRVNHDAIDNSSES